MDFSGFPSDSLASLIGAAVGIVLGLQVDRWKMRRDSKDRDRRLIQNLVNGLAGKRAFGHPDDIGLVDDPPDRERCLSSILDARARIARVCDEVVALPEVVPILREMENDCMAYLNYVERHEDAYAVALIRLRDRLTVHELGLKVIVRELDLVRPGARDGETPAWLIEPIPRRHA